MTEEKNIRPWDIFKKNVEKVTDIEYKKRMSICNECPEFIKLTTQCKECGCIMSSKAKLLGSTCPLKKWGIMSVPLKEELKGESN